MGTMRNRAPTSPGSRVCRIRSLPSPCHRSLHRAPPTLPRLCLPLSSPILRQRCGLPSLTCHSNLAFLACTPPGCARFARVNHPSFFRIEHVHLYTNKKTEPLLREIPSFPTAFRLQFSGLFLLYETDTFFSHLQNIDFLFSCQAIDSYNPDSSRLSQVYQEPTALRIELYAFPYIRLC